MKRGPDQIALDSSTRKGSGEPEDHRLIFVGGLHRSGTTLLFETIRAHPVVSGFEFPGGAEREHEGQFHQSVFPTARRGEGPGYFALDDRAHLDETSKLVTEANARKLFKEWARHWDLSKPYLLEKSPQNLVRTRFLQRLFPVTYFLMMIRHPVAVSLATMKWMGWPRHVVAPVEKGAQQYKVRPSTRDDHAAFYESEQLYTESMLYTLFSNWTMAHETYMADIVHLDNCLTVRYEDLIAQPQKSLESVCDFLGVDRADPPERLFQNHNRRYFDAWLTMAPDLLTNSGRHYLTDTFADSFSRFGYSLTDLESDTPIRTPA